MKILHALLSYLAVTALPFQLFAYSLAAIDYDGYVNSTQNHGDRALVKRGIPEEVLLVAIIAEILLVIYWIGSDNPKRETFTQGTITQTISKYPEYNWVICHSPYSVGFDGDEFKDWGHTHHELGISFGRTIGYDLYWAKSGTFYRYGDGGFINWAYNGKILGTDNGGATVHFGTPS